MIRHIIIKKVNKLNDLDDLDFMNDLGIFDDEDDNDNDAAPDVVPVEQDGAAVCMESRLRLEKRRANSEHQLDEVLDWDLKDGVAYHVLSLGDIDALTYVRAIVRAHPADYVLLSTWCMGKADVAEVHEWVKKGYIKRLDMYVGEIFKSNYPEVYSELLDFVPKTGGRVAMFRNHAKTSLVAARDGLRAVVTSSANMNTNPRHEVTVISVSAELFDFYKRFYDGIKPFNKRGVPKNWTPWTE